MNKAEQKSKEQAKLEGWRVLTVGKPDKILFRIDSEGQVRVRFREDKGTGDRLSNEQKVYLTLLVKMGLSAEVWYEWGESGFTKDWVVGETEEKMLLEYGENCVL